MAVIQVNQLGETRQSTLGEDNQRQHILEYQAITDSKADDSWSVMAAVVSSTGLDKDSPHPLDTVAVVRKITSKSLDGLKQWLVTYEFGTRTQEEEEALDNPLNRPCELSWSVDFVEKPIDFTFDGTAIRNSAGDPFDPTIVIQDPLPRFTVTKNFAAFNSSAATTMVNKLNSGSFFGHSAGTVKLSNISGELQNEDIDGTNVQYWRVTHDFHVKASWDEEILDAGYRKLEGGVKKPILRGGQPVTAPEALDGSGGELDSTSAPVTKTYTIYQSADFSTLNLSC